MTDIMQRFPTEAEAREAARAASLDLVEPDPVYVIESPPRDAESDVRCSDGRFVIDNNGGVRSWERSVACYVRGVEDPDG